MFCKNCGTQVNDTAAFCPKCGTPTGAGNPSASNNVPTPVNRPILSDGLDVDKLKKNVSDFKDKFNGSSFDESGQLNLQMEMPRKIVLLIAFLIALIGTYIGSVGIEMSYKHDDASMSVSIVGLSSVDMDDFDYMNMDDLNEQIDDIKDKYISVGTYLGWMLVNVTIIVSLVLAIKAFLRFRSNEINGNMTFYNYMQLALCCLALKYIWFLGTVFIELDIIDDMLEEALDKYGNKNLDMGFYVSITYWIFLAIIIAASVFCWIWRKEFISKAQRVTES